MGIKNLRCRSLMEFKKVYHKVKIKEDSVVRINKKTSKRFEVKGLRRKDPLSLVRFSIVLKWEIIEADIHTGGLVYNEGR